MALSSTDPKALFQQAACFNCPEPHRNIVLQTYLLAQLAGVSTTAAGVQALEAAAACFDCLTIPQLLRLKTYLYAVLLGKSTDYGGVAHIVKDARCVMCLTPLERRQLETYMLAVSAGDATTKAGVASIVAAATCFNCLTAKEQWQVQVYLLTQIAPGQDTLSVSDLMQASKCFQSCLPGDIVTATMLQLAIVVTGTALPPCVTPSAPTNVGVGRTPPPLAGSQIRVVWSQPANTGSLITSYTVKWGTVSGTYTNSATVPVTPKHYDITGLSSGTQYFFVVVANASAAVGCTSTNSNEANATTSGGASGPCAAGTTFATNWANRVVANGGAAPSAATQTAIANYWCSVITAGLDTKLKMVADFVPDSFIAATTSLLGNTNNPFINHNFVNADLGPNGLTGNAATKYLETGFVPRIEMGSAVDAGYCFYAYNTTTTGFCFGSYNGTTENFMGAAKHSDGKSYAYNGTAANVINPASSGNGFYASNRLNATDHRFFFASSVSAFAQIGATDVVNDTSALPQFQSYIMAENDAGAPQFHCSDTISHVAEWEGFTTADVQAYFNIVQALKVALGGGFR